MDLFVINRYKDEDEVSGSLDREALNLQKLKQRIEERKKANLARKATSKTEIILQPRDEPVLEPLQKTIYTITTQKSEEKLPELQRLSNSSEVEETKERNEAKNEKSVTEFKVLGVNEFEKKVKGLKVLNLTTLEQQRHREDLIETHKILKLHYDCPELESMFVSNSNNHLKGHSFKLKVKRVLPYWLSHPLSVSTSLQDLSARVEDETWLHPTLRQTLQAEGVTHLFPVQKSVAPYVLKAHQTAGPFWPNDVCVSAPTGSGKTLAFVLPIVQVLMQRQTGTEARALVVVPVQELAQQVARVFRKYCTHTRLKVALLSAATQLSQEQRQLVRYIPWESNIPKDHNFKVNKYCNLVDRIVRNGFKTDLFAVEVGARGLPAKSLYSLFKNLGLPRSTLSSFMERASKATLEASYRIWIAESRGWVSEVDIIVCTAGRLVEHLRGTEGFSLRRLRFLVIDEADRIMDNIQNDWLYHLDRHIKLDSELMTGKVPMLSWNNLISQKCPPHKLLFSATLSQDPEKLEQWGLFQPKLFSAGHDHRASNDDEDAIRKYTTPDELTEQCIVCDAEQKPLILYYLLTEKKWNRVLCFANAAQSAHRLAALLNKMGEGQLKVAEISAALDRHSREAVLKKFHAGEINVLISTDALARGIDVPLCDYVVSYDPPKNIKTYVHRVGRTGRAGRPGCGVTMLLHTQTTLFKTLLNSGGKTSLPKIDIPGNIYGDYAEKYERAIHETKNQIHNEIHTKVKKSIALKRGFKSTDRKRKNSDRGQVKSKKLRKSSINKD